MLESSVHELHSDWHRFLGLFQTMITLLDILNVLFQNPAEIYFQEQGNWLANLGNRVLDQMGF